MREMMEEEYKYIKNLVEMADESFDVHDIVYVGGIEVWISDGRINNWLGNPEILNQLEFKEVHRSEDAAIFKGRRGWIVFVLDRSEWSLEHCYIPDPENKYTLKQIIQVAKILKQKIKEELEKLGFE